MKSSRRGRHRPRPLTPPGIRFRTTAVQGRLWSLTTVSTSDTSPNRAKYRFGKATFRCEAPLFHHGPRPLLALLHARSSGNPSLISARALVAGRFHCRHRIPRSLRRSQPSTVYKAR